jgi:hypothetical protein
VKDYLNINEAAKVAGVSIPTVRRKLDLGLLPNAHQVQEGKRQLWRIPFSDLIAAGMVDSVSQPPAEVMQSGKIIALEVEIDRLSAELANTKALLARADEQIEDLRQARRDLSLVLETRETQERRRFAWFSRTP